MDIPKSAFESEWVLKAISHSIRQRILNLIADNTFQSYTELLQKLSLSTGKLNFHLKQLTGLIEKQSDGTYILTSIGKKTINILKQINSIGEDKEQVEYFKSIALSKSLKQFEPATETKKKWYFWILIIYGLFIWIPLIITESVLDLNLLNILTNSQKSLRIITNIGIYTGIILVVFIVSIFTAKKYLESISYEILDTEIMISKGLVVKTKTIIPFRTITNLVIKQGPIDLLLGISTLIIQTAGESVKSIPEGKLIGIYYAHDLIEEILNLVRLLDPPSYLREKIAFSTTSKNITTLYSQILSELQKMDEKLSE
ncbi:MAG: PH domain-containing protein [Candidatus Heimdallarchaeota archaeon]